MEAATVKQQTLYIVCLLKAKKSRLAELASFIAEVMGVLGEQFPRPV